MSPAEATGAAARMSPLPRWLRVFFLLNVVQDFAIGLTGLLAPMTFAHWEEFTTDGVPWLWMFTSAWPGTTCPGT